MSKKWEAVQRGTRPSSALVDRCSATIDGGHRWILTDPSYSNSAKPFSAVVTAFSKQVLVVLLPIMCTPSEVSRP